MTWTYDIADDGSQMDIYEDDPEFSGLVATGAVDDNGDHRYEDADGNHILTMEPPRGSGWTATIEVETVMRATWEAEANLGSSPVMSVRAGHILMDLVTGNIEEGVPE